MNRKSGSGSGPFLMEMLVVVGFFIICASICVLVFVKADNISKDARDINQAVLKAQSLAEELKAGQALRWSEMLPDRNIWEHLADADEGTRSWYRAKATNESIPCTGTAAGRKLNLTVNPPFWGSYTPEQWIRWSGQTYLSCATAEGPIRERCCTGCRQRPMPAPKTVYRRI